jgi:hypothetical protein
MSSIYSIRFVLPWRDLNIFFQRIFWFSLWEEGTSNELLRDWPPGFRDHTIPVNATKSLGVLAKEYHRYAIPRISFEGTKEPACPAMIFPPTRLLYG